MHWYPQYIPIGARRAQALEEMRKLREQGVRVQPIEIRGRAIARSFWGRRWCEHLESFSDYENRLPRGRTYVRNGSVCHLEVGAGGVEAMVAGSAVYHVVIRIRKLKKPAWKAIKTACAGQIGSVLELLQGRLSDHVMNVVADRDTGLFPTPREIKLACDCPDWATMCKHVAAVLYGVGSRLDDSPELLFLLRGVDEAELIATDMALPHGTATADGLADGDLEDIFGIDLDPAEVAVAADQAAPTPNPRIEADDPTPQRTTRAARARSRDTGATTSRFRPTGGLVAELRQRSGFTAVELAELLQVSASTIYRWEAAPGLLNLRAPQRDALMLLQSEIETLEG